MLCLGAGPVRAEQSLDPENPGFERGLDGWDLADDGGMSKAVPDAAHDGQYGLRVADASATAGSSLASAKFKVVPGKSYQARFWARMVAGDGIGVYLQFFDAAGHSFASSKEMEAKYDLVPFVLSAKQKEWKEFLISKVAPEGAVEGRIWVHSFLSATVTADFDGFHLSELD